MKSILISRPDVSHILTDETWLLSDAPINIFNTIAHDFFFSVLPELHEFKRSTSLVSGYHPLQ